VAAHAVKAEGGHGLVRLLDPAVGYQPQLDEGLEAVADPQDEAVPLFQQFCYFL
jgi:hypothetical protein